MERSVRDAVREGFVVQHVGEGAKKGSGVVQTGVRLKAALGLRQKTGSSQEQFAGCWVMLRRVKEQHWLL